MKAEPITDEIVVDALETPILIQKKRPMVNHEREWNREERRNDGLKHFKYGRRGNLGR